MSHFADVGDVRARLPGRNLDESGGKGKVSALSVNKWIEFADDLVQQLLPAVGIAVPPKGSKGGNILGEKITTYAEGRTRKAFAQAGGDGNNTDGDSQITEFNDWCTDISERTAFWSAILAPGGGASEASLRMRGFANDPDDNPPVFKRSEEF